MEELEQSANHSAEEVVEETVTEETPIDQQETTEETPATTQDDFFEVKYNKETKRISRDEAPSYIQKGLNYDKVSQRVSEYEQNLNRIAQFAGYQSHDELVQALEDAERQQQIQAEAQKLGVNEDTYKQHFEPVNTEVKQLKQELETLRAAEQAREVQRELDSLKQKYPDFQEYEETVFKVAIDKGYNLEDAYKIATYEERLSKIAREKEQEVLAKVTGRDEKQVLASNDQPNNTKFDPNNMSFDEIEALSRRARQGERITF
jgi:hypothetical protein